MAFGRYACSVFLALGLTVSHETRRLVIILSNMDLLVYVIVSCFHRYRLKQYRFVHITSLLLASTLATHSLFQEAADAIRYVEYSIYGAAIYVACSSPNSQIKAVVDQLSAHTLEVRQCCAHSLPWKLL